MKYSLKLIILGFLVSLTSSTFAQNGKFSGAASIGLTTPILDNGVGFSVSGNLSFNLTSHISAETQLSFLDTRTSSSFISGDKGNTSTLNYFLGAKVYLTSPEKSGRVYLNILPGINFNSESSDGSDRVKESAELGFSAGAYLEFRKLVTGISIESPQNLVLRVGYVF